MALAILFSCKLSFAQSDSTTYEDMSLKKMTAILKDAREKELNFIKEDAFSTNSQIRIGTGIMLPMINTSNNPDIYNIGEGYDWCDDSKGISLGIEYSYRVWDFLEVVGSLHYWGGDHQSMCPEDMYGFGDNKIATFTNNEQIAFGIYGRYNWYNSKWVSLYSTLGVWILATNATLQNHKTGDFERKWFTHCYAMPELTPFGIRVGRKFFGYFEPITIGARSNVLNIGLGFRF